MTQTDLCWSSSTQFERKSYLKSHLAHELATKNYFPKVPLPAFTTPSPKKDIVSISSLELRPETDPARAKLSSGLGNGY